MRLFAALIVFVFVTLLGCVSPTASNDAVLSPASPNVPPLQVENGPGTPVIFCNAFSPEENEECFEDAFETCEKALGVFWKTSDGFPLYFETLGLDTASGKCRVRVNPSDDESIFFGQSAACAVEKSPPDESHSTSFFDVYSIGPDSCSGTFVDALTASLSKTNSSDSSPSQPSAPLVKEFSFSVDDSGVVGANEFSVSAGDTVRLTITTSTSNVSFGGSWTRAPAGPKLNDSEYIFSTGTVSPGGSKTVEFTAQESFEFGIYWPGSNVLKGKGKIVVTP